jgi:site-specific DNA-cytosine methylase
VDTTKEPITPRLNTLSFCTGYGGIELGLRMAGVPCRVIAASEIEAYATANLVSKMERGEMDPAPIWTDLATFPLQAFRGKVDMLIGGFPCQPFSSAGSRKADTDPRHLWPHFKRTINELKPEFIFLENVDGIASAKLKGNGWADPPDTPVLLHVLREVERMGYHATAGCFTAAETGSPHQRKRWFILATLGNSEYYGHIATSINREIPQGKEEGGMLKSEGTSNTPKQKWPAKPYQQQYNWEEPRVLDHTKSYSDRGKIPYISEKNAEQPKSKEQYQNQSRKSADASNDVCTNNTHSQCQLDGTNNGSPCGVDPVTNRMERLRLLGNGVVPHTVQTAWNTLIKDFDFLYL